MKNKFPNNKIHVTLDAKNMHKYFSQFKNTPSHDYLDLPQLI